LLNYTLDSMPLVKDVSRNRLAVSNGTEARSHEDEQLLRQKQRIDPRRLKAGGGQDWLPH
jgi:hypothetical protein